ncbi:MAG: DUF4177 domain-containing protein [Phycisphaerae bacterium]|nr:DUF4177 domain-containing protein [Phycisphaerae bacterium]
MGILKKHKFNVLMGLALMICTGLVMQALAQDQGQDIRQPPATRWQHLALTQTLGETLESELGRNINRLGREGWELVSVAGITKAGTTTKTVFYFKKPL